MGVPREHHAFLAALPNRDFGPRLGISDASRLVRAVKFKDLRPGSQSYDEMVAEGRKRVG